MKFCKNLQRVVDISDPEWAPYWTNYKMLKKLIKELPSLVPADINSKQLSSGSSRFPSPSSVASSSSSSHAVEDTPQQQPQQQNDKNTASTFPSSDLNSPAPAPATTPAQPPTSSLKKMLQEDFQYQTRAAVVANLSVSKTAPAESIAPTTTADPAKRMGKSPGEVAFFKLLHSELKKAVHFFDKAQQEFIIREERVREGMEIMKKSNRIMVSDRWTSIARSLYRLYKDLMLLETFAIMSYCSFSKILKKHDKVTGYNTRNAFMTNVVSKANFTSYPKILAMISRCEILFKEVSQHLLAEGKDCLHEDERLFINMIHRLNEQVMDTAEEDDVLKLSERIEKNKQSSFATIAGKRRSSPATTNSSPRSERSIGSSLKSLVEENEQKVKAVVPLATSGENEDEVFPHPTPATSTATTDVIDNTIANGKKRLVSDAENFSLESKRQCCVDTKTDNVKGGLNDEDNI